MFEGIQMVIYNDATNNDAIDGCKKPKAARATSCNVSIEIVLFISNIKFIKVQTYPPWSKLGIMDQDSITNEHHLG